MKKLSILMLSLMASPTFAQSMLGTLNQHQDSLKAPESSSSSSSSAQEVQPSSETISSSSQKCEENDQTSLPLTYVTSLIQEKDAALDILHDPRAGTLTVSSADMIGNCSSMLEWKLKKPTIQDQQAYAVEVAIKKGDDCSDEGCSYKVAKVENGSFKEHQSMILKPTLKGFEDCLQKSGVIVDGKVDAGAIYSTPVKEKFSGLSSSGQLLFLSHGPASPLAKAKYGKFEHIAACDHYEAAHPDVRKLLTLADAEQLRLDEEAEKLRECKADEYYKLSDFIEKYESYSDELGAIRDELILEAARKSATAITEGKYTDEDLDVLADFEKYVVNPKIQLAVSLYEESLELEGDAKKAKQEELKEVLAQITALNKSPYFLPGHIVKLLNDGKFDEAEKMNSFKLMLKNYQRLGAKESNVVITPEVAAQRVASARADFSQTVTDETERYEIRTGQVTGNSEYYAALAARMTENINVRTQNFNNEIMSEYQRVQQPNGYCYRYWRNAQKCIQDTTERIQELQALLAHYNKIDTERAEEYAGQAQEYGELEAQGRRYVAAQNGEVPEEDPATESVPEADTTAVPERVNTSGVYNFEYKGGGTQQPMYQQQAQMMPQQYQQPVNPYQTQNMFQQPYNPYGYQQQHQSPWMGQQSYGMQSQYGMQGQYGMQSQFGMQPQFGMQGQNGYSFNWNGGGGMQGQQNPYMNQQQQGYWQQPYQSYSMNTMYGR